ncbi:MAG: cupredoxin domain-containing protein [Sphingobacteriales bacterium]|nr:cupredoxin domain-containing protein [Sphingobacteriales bacterium]MBI3718405.1 cupredoxin domain-containing protein [Sphingobacteriales bacterium]
MKKCFYIAILLISVSAVVSCSKKNSYSSGGGNNPPPSGNAVAMSGMAFGPASISVTVGTTVTWTNNDAMSHTVTSNDGTSFNSGTIASGSTFSFKFMTAGTYAYHCTFHAGMTGTVVVTP